ncbi:YdeI/OmpD-associated family protein [Roseobacteraceae bacterium S113]
MSDYITFEATIEPMIWGKSTYTVLHLPDAVVTALGKTRRVEGELGDHPVNLALTKAPVAPGPFLWAGKSLLDRIGLQPGETFEARLRPASDDLVEVPADITRAVRSAGVTEAWEALSPGKQRGHIHQIESAKRPETRAKRITALIRALDPA